MQDVVPPRSHPRRVYDCPRPILPFEYLAGWGINHEIDVTAVGRACATRSHGHRLCRDATAAPDNRSRLAHRGFERDK